MGVWMLAPSMKVFVSHVNTHQQAFTMKEALSNQEDKTSLGQMTSASLCCQLLSAGTKGT